MGPADDRVTAQTSRPANSTTYKEKQAQPRPTAQSPCFRYAQTSCKALTRNSRADGPCHGSCRQRCDRSHVEDRKRGPARKSRPRAPLTPGKPTTKSSRPRLERRRWKKVSPMETKKKQDEEGCRGSFYLEEGWVLLEAMGLTG
ncbi:hypothetical protein NDU88_007146 [Pleurodeles waltl]|uniref:Uncharacterized protein n=1 Tax=Pleurodeles waltl TaxID=8319 RepID=A0AAV7N658_PLEWA|nr:hypothetical protein NDU88_007146 [Pleurodeles waltl]